MSVTGRKPKPAGEAVHRNAPTHEWTEVEDVPFDNAPSLPALRPSGTEWSEHLTGRWRVWSRMPHCILWTESDWAFAIDSLEVAAIWLEKGGANYCAELRHREKILGTTADFRRDLRIRYVQPRKLEAAPVVSIDDYRNL